MTILYIYIYILCIYIYYIYLNLASPSLNELTKSVRAVTESTSDSLSVVTFSDVLEMKQVLMV